MIPVRSQWGRYNLPRIVVEMLKNKVLKVNWLSLATSFVGIIHIFSRLKESLGFVWELFQKKWIAYLLNHFQQQVLQAGSHRKLKDPNSNPRDQRQWVGSPLKTSMEPQAVGRYPSSSFKKRSKLCDEVGSPQKWSRLVWQFQTLHWVKFQKLWFRTL